MASPALEQPKLFARTKDPDGTAFRTTGLGRDRGSNVKRRSAMLSKNYHTRDDQLPSLLLAPPPPPPPPPTTLKNTYRSQSATRQRSSYLAKTDMPHRSLESYDSWDHIKHQSSLPSVVATHSDDFTVSTIASPRQAILAERFRAARAIYQSDTLVLDAVPEEMTPLEKNVVARTRPLSILPAASSVTATTATTVSGSIPSRRSPTGSSEDSGSTKMIANHSSFAKDSSVTPPKRRLKIRTLERMKSSEKEKRPKTPKRLRLALRPKKGVEISPPNPKPKHRGITPVEMVVKDLEKKSDQSVASNKGFFGKLFRTGKKKKAVGVTSRSDESTLQTEVRSETTASQRQPSDSSGEKDKENSMKETLVRTGGDAGRAQIDNRDTSLLRGRSILYHGHDEVSTLTAPTFNSLGKRSLDPDSCESMSIQRVHEPSGRYSRRTLDIDTVASYVGSVTDPPDHNDSPTTINTRRTSIDPTDDTPRTRGSEPRESRPRVRDPSPKHLLRDPSPTAKENEILFDFEVRRSNHEAEGPEGSSPHHSLHTVTSLQVVPDPPLESVLLDDDESLESEEPTRRSEYLLSAVPPPPPPPRQTSSYRHVVIRSPINSNETINRRSPRHRLVHESPQSILRSKPDGQRWNGTDPIDSDLILEMENGLLDGTIENKQVTKDSKSKQLSTWKAARLNAKTMTHMHQKNNNSSPKLSQNQLGESDDFVSPKQLENIPIGGVSGLISKPGTQKGALNRPISNTTFVARNERFKVRSQTRKLKRAMVASKTNRMGPRHGTPFSIGTNMLRRRREDGIASGKHKKSKPKSKRIAPESDVKKNKTTETRDPIQIAGRRLLSKSAIPIQSAARRFLAQREAIDRMWGILEIQCYLRRWKAEATLLAYRNSALTIQRVYRGTQARKVLELQHLAATEIQKVIRGYLACVSTFDTVYRIIVVQSLVRGFLVRTRMRRFEDRCREYSAIKVQQWWRCVSCQRNYQFFIVDVLIIQSAFRRWRSQREYKAIIDFRRTEAAKRIQATWRGFQSYSDYIFSLVDVVNVQRTARRWLAIRRVETMRRDKAATKIQSQFRKYSSQYKLLLSLMNAILVQSAVRMFLAKRLLARKRAEYKAKQVAAIKIQAAWRGFSSFTDYIIAHYHFVKFQSLFRGFLVRRQARLRLGSIVMIQSHARKFLATEKVRKVQVGRALIRGQSKGMRETTAANRIQFWWRVVLDCRKEKRAALVIERFFLMVKREVDMEIARVQRRQMEKRRFKKEKLPTLTEESSNASSTSKSTTKNNKKNTCLVSSSPQSHGSHKVTKADSFLSSDSLNFTYSADDSDMSTMFSAHSTQNQQSAPRTAAEKYASMFGIRTKKSLESQHKYRYVGHSIENTLSSGSSIHGIQFTASPGGSTGVSSPSGSLSEQNAKPYRGRNNVKHFDFDVNADDEFGLI